MSTTEQTTTTAGRRQVSPSKAEVAEARALAKEVGLEYVDLERYPLNAAATSLLPQQASRRHHALAVGWKFGTPVVAVARPDNVMAMDDLRTAIGRDIHAVVACESQIDAYIDRMYTRAETSAPAPNGRGLRGSTDGAAKSQSTATAPSAEAPTTDSTGPVVPEPPARPPVPEPPAPPPDTVPSTRAGGSRHAAEKQPSEPTLHLVPEEAEAAEPTALTPPADEEAEALLAASKLLEATTAGKAKAPAEVAKSTPGLAELLMSSGQVTREEMEAALREQAATGRSLGDILSELGLVSEEDLIRASAAEAGMEFVDLNEQPLDPEATKLIPESLARRHRVLALGYRGDTPIIGMANPSDVFAVDDLRTLLGTDIQIVVCSAGQIAEYLSRVYRHDRETTLAAQTAASQTSAGDETKITELTDLHAVVEDAPIVKYVNLILRQALQERASDIHIEPTSDDLRIRFRN